MAEHPCTSESGMMNLSHPTQALPQDLQNLVMTSSGDAGNMAISKSQGMSMPMGNMNPISAHNAYREVPVSLQSNGQGPVIPTGNFMPQQNNTYIPDSLRNYAVPDTRMSQESYLHNPTQGLNNKDYSMSVPYSNSIAGPTQTTSVRVNTEETPPTNTTAHEMSLAPMTADYNSSSKPQSKIILKTDTPSGILPDQRASNMPSIHSHLDDVAYKITTSDVTEAISAIRTTAPRVATGNTAPFDTSANTTSPHHLVVTAMGLVRKNFTPGSQPMESGEQAQIYPPSNYETTNPQHMSTLPSQVKGTARPQLGPPTMTENTMQSYTFTDTHPSRGPLLPENEMIQSSHAEHMHGEPLSGRGMSASMKQGEKRSQMNMDVGSYMSVDQGRKAENQPRIMEDDMSFAIRKSYRAPKKKAVSDYADIIGANEDELQKKKAKTVTGTSSNPTNPTKGDNPGNKPIPKSRNKLTVEEVYRSGDEGEDMEMNNEFLKVRMLKCDKCDKHFIDKKKLAQHKRQVHNDRKGPRSSSKDHVCDVCGYLFKRREHWRRHKEVHQKSRPYNCDVCNKTFKRAEHVKRHQSVHLSTKPYPCMECSSAFTRADHLAKHALLHSDPDGYRQKQLAKKRKARAAKGKAKGSKMIKTVPRGRGKVTVQLRATVPPKKEEGFEYGDVLEKGFQESGTDEDDLLSSEEDEDAEYEEQKDQSNLEKVF